VTDALVVRNFSVLVGACRSAVYTLTLFLSFCFSFGFLLGSSVSYTSATSCNTVPRAVPRWALVLGSALALKIWETVQCRRRPPKWISRWLRSPGNVFWWCRFYSLYSGILISLIFDLFVELGHQYGGDGGDGCQSHGGGDIDQCHDRHRIENDDQWWVENVQWERHANNIVASKSQWSNKWRNIFYFF
jgi:hypothetical protein